MTSLTPPPPPPPPPRPLAPITWTGQSVSPVRIDGAALVVPLNYQFPEICVVSGATTDLVRVRRTLYWHPPALYLTIFLGLLIYVILAVVLRKTAYLTFSLARAERARHWKWLAASWTSFLLTFVCLGIGGATDVTAFFLIAPLFLVGSLVLAFVKARIVYAVRANERSMWLRGIRPEVMAKIAGSS